MRFIIFSFTLLIANIGFGQILVKNTKTLSDTSQIGISPYFTTDKSQKVYLSWLEKSKTQKISFYFSSFDGKNFGGKKQIPCPDNISTHAEGKPMIAINEQGHIYATFELKKYNPESRFASDLLYTLSTDGGNTWSKPTFIQSDRDINKSHSFCKIIRLQDGTIGAIWLDEKLTEKGRSVKFAKTQANGQFGEPILVDNQACECCRIEAIITQKGDLQVYYRDIFDNQYRDIARVISHNNGETFELSERLYNDNWEIDACPHAGPTVSAHSENVLISYYTGKLGGQGINLVNNNKKLLTKNTSEAIRTPQLAHNKSHDLLWVYCKKEEQKQGSIGVLYAELIGKNNSKKAITSGKNISNNPTLIPLENQWLLAYESTNNLNKVSICYSILEAKK